MKKLFDEFSAYTARLITQKYSTSFSLAVKLLPPKVRAEIYNIYGFVRLADEIVDSFHQFPKKELLNEFEQDYYQAYEKGISLNPILNAFQSTVKKYNIEQIYISAFLNSMRTDLSKRNYHSQKEINNYIHGSADAVALMCLKVFVNGSKEKFHQLKQPAMHLGSAFQKVNFLRDIKQDFKVLNRSYFPKVNLNNISNQEKMVIIKEIKENFREAYKGILILPIEVRLSVYVAYRYYLRLLKKLEKTSSEVIINKRIRISDLMKLIILGESYIRFQLNKY